MRKIIYTKVLIDLIAGCIFDGLTDEETGLLAGVSGKQIGRLRAGDDCQQIRVSVVERMRKYIALIRDGDDRSNRWQRIAWFLERRYPDRWAKPEVLLNVNAGSNVTNNTLVITAEQAANLKNRNASIDKALQELVPPGSRDRTHGTIPEEAKSLIIKDSVSQLHSVVPNDGESLVNDSVPNKAESIDDLSATTPAPLPRTPDVAAAGVAPSLSPKSKILENLKNQTTEKNLVGIPGGIPLPKQARKKSPPKVLRGRPRGSRNKG